MAERPTARRARTLAARLVTLALAVLVGWTAWDGYRALTTPPADPVADPPLAPPTGGPPSPAPTVPPEREIAALHLFGRPDAPAPEPDLPDPEEAPETRLNLELMGVLSSSETGTARAIILAGNTPEKHYRVGDRVPAGATIAEIRSDSVLLERNGRYETLRLRRKEKATAAAAPPPAAQASPPSFRDLIRRSRD